MREMFDQAPRNRSDHRTRRISNNSGIIGVTEDRLVRLLHTSSWTNFSNETIIALGITTRDLPGGTDKQIYHAHDNVKTHDASNIPRIYWSEHTLQPVPDMARVHITYEPNSPTDAVLTISADVFTGNSQFNSSTSLTFSSDGQLRRIMKTVNTRLPDGTIIPDHRFYTRKPTEDGKDAWFDDQLGKPILLLSGEQLPEPVADTIKDLFYQPTDAHNLLLHFIKTTRRIDIAATLKKLGENFNSDTPLPIRDPSLIVYQKTSAVDRS